MNDVYAVIGVFVALVLGSIIWHIAGKIDEKE